MSETIETVLETEIKRFDITEAVIEQMKTDFTPLQIDGIEDREGYKKVHEARMLVKEKRCEVERRRKVLKAPFLDAGEKIDMEAKRITKLLEPIEDELEAKEKAIDEERERIKEQERKKEEERVQALFEKLQSVGAYLDPGVIKEMTEEGFENYYQARKADHEKAEAERKRIEKEAEEKRKTEELARKQEAEKLAKEKAELEAEKKRLADERAKLDAEKRAAEQEAKKEEAEPTPQPHRPVAPPPVFCAPKPLTLSEIVMSLSSAGYRNHQRALVDDIHFIELRKMAKGSVEITP